MNRNYRRRPVLPEESSNFADPASASPPKLDQETQTPLPSSKISCESEGIERSVDRLRTSSKMQSLLASLDSSIPSTPAPPTSSIFRDLSLREIMAIPQPFAWQTGLPESMEGLLKDYKISSFGGLIDGPIKEASTPQHSYMDLRMVQNLDWATQIVNASHSYFTPIKPPSARGAIDIVKHGHIDQAYKEFHRALSITPKCSTAYVGRGLILLSKGDPRAAQREFRRALEVCPTDMDAKKYLEDLAHPTSGPHAAGLSSGRRRDSLFGIAAPLKTKEEQEADEEEMRKLSKRKAVTVAPLELRLDVDSLPNFRRHGQHRARPPPPPPPASSGTTTPSSSQVLSSSKVSSRGLRETLESKVSRAHALPLATPSSISKGASGSLALRKPSDPYPPASLVDQRPLGPNRSISSRKDIPMTKMATNAPRPSAAARAMASKYETDSPKSASTFRQPVPPGVKASRSTTLLPGVGKGSPDITRTYHDRTFPGDAKSHRDRVASGGANPPRGKVPSSGSKYPRERVSSDDARRPRDRSASDKNGKYHDKDALTSSKSYSGKDVASGSKNRQERKGLQVSSRSSQQIRQSTVSHETFGRSSTKRPRSPDVKPKAIQDNSPDSSPLSSAPEMSDEEDDALFYGLDPGGSSVSTGLGRKRTIDDDDEAEGIRDRKKIKPSSTESSPPPKAPMNRAPMKARRVKRRIIMDNESSE
ncbi:hypothetical protein BJ684DRAFT_14752 [Piptocephalis cylindrospora]|uniref:Uncharacterized protein n=1 Tax=Piptocephalis cylindrospora TaxID=1907219 RepID=A0A4P9Y766_9FUNG|nr:hypothetical protein BJ684DRAFT_14752 [Piptocephalis cylindrospora]|eukprot:RKP14957.1 hypothetical protein BJ684DRAFT_14752 [Piptocephalis cylindrospora]